MGHAMYTGGLPVPEGVELLEYVVEGIYAVGEGMIGNELVTAAGADAEFEPSLMVAFTVIVYDEINSKKRVLALTVSSSVLNAILPRLAGGLASLPSMGRAAEGEENEEDEKRD